MASHLEDILVDHIDWGNDMLVNVFPLWKEKILCDTTIVCENDESLQAHSILLAAASPSLYSFFRNSEQGTYVFRCTSVPLSIWKNCVTFIYTGRLDIGKEELVPTYNLANKLAMFNFSKQLATQLRSHGLVRGGMMKTPEELEGDKKDCSKPSDEDLLEDIKEESTIDETIESVASGFNLSLDSTEIDEGIGGDSIDPGPSMSPFNDIAVASPDLTAFSVDDLARNDSAESSFNEQTSPDLDYEIDDIILSSTEDASTGLGADNRYECPHCFMNFKRLSALKKHLRCCRTAKKLGMLPDAEGPFMGKLVIGTKNSWTSLKPSLANRNPYTHIRHMYTKMDDGHFQCNLCENPCKTYNGIYLHIKVKHLGTKYQRPKSRMKESLEKKKENEDDLLNDLPSEAKQHCIVNNHSYYKLRCRTCGKLFKNKTAFIMHVKMHHSHNKLRNNEEKKLNKIVISSSTLVNAKQVSVPSSVEESHPTLSLPSISSLPLSSPIASHIPSALSVPPSPVLTLSRGSSNLTSTIMTPLPSSPLVSSKSSSSTSIGLGFSNSDNYKCSKCDRTFFKKVNLGCHMRVHDPDYHTKSLKKKKKLLKP